MPSPRLPGAPAPSALASTSPLHLLTSLTRGPVQGLCSGPRPRDPSSDTTWPAPLPSVSTRGVFQVALALFSPESLFRSSSRLVRSRSICWRISKSLLQSIISPTFGPFSLSMNCFYWYLRPTQHAWQFSVSQTEFTIFSSKLALLQESSSQEMTPLSSMPCPPSLLTSCLCNT